MYPLYSVLLFLLYFNQHRMSFQFLKILHLVFLSSTVSSDNGGWDTLAHLSSSVKKGPCNIQKHDASSLTINEFRNKLSFEPLIITGVDNLHFREKCTKAGLVSNFGDRSVVLSSANTHSYSKKSVLLSEYFDKYLNPDLNQMANETYYLFGDIDRDEWSAFLKEYTIPLWTLPAMLPELSFGIAGAGTGVPFHFHGPGFAEVIYGVKRWFLYPPESKPNFDPDKTTYDWVLNEYPNLKSNKPLECILGPGELLYFPDRWWHATLNLETSVFMSTFLSH